MVMDEAQDRAIIGAGVCADDAARRARLADQDNLTTLSSLHRKAGPPG